MSEEKRCPACGERRERGFTCPNDRFHSSTDDQATTSREDAEESPASLFPADRDSGGPFLIRSAEVAPDPSTLRTLRNNSDAYQAWIKAADTLSADVADEIEAILRTGTEQPLSDEEIRRLLSEVIVVVRAHARDRGDTETVEALEGEKFALQVLAARKDERYAGHGNLGLTPLERKLLRLSGFEPWGKHGWIRDNENGGTCYDDKWAMREAMTRG